jgi:ATP-dependent helicase HrpB
MPSLVTLPIDEHLPRIARTLSDAGRLVLVAETGAGKTTRVPPALLDTVSGRVLMLQPRRVAARAAAGRIADERGWRLGHEVGYQVRHERRISEATRVEVVTEGILTRRLQADPFLEGVGAVLLDEFHERSLHADLALALLAEVRREARPELALLVMSATLDAAPLSRFLDDAPRIEVPGRRYPVTISYASTLRSDAARRGAERLETRVADAVERALSSSNADTDANIDAAAANIDAEGDVLVFLPGVGEIARVAEQLEQRRTAPSPASPLERVDVLSLHGSLPLEAQQRALRPGPTGRRRVVLATNVAETSVTIPAITTVIDSGLVRQLRFDPASGLDRLETLRCSVASAEQRAGRAGRVRPGRALRLWTETEQRSLPQQTSPEIRRVDLTRTALEVRAWGSDPRQFGWFEAPAASALSTAELLLERLGALRGDDRAVTPLGQAMLELPLHPRLARILLAVAPEAGDAELRSACAMVALIGERDLLLAEHRRGDRPSADSDLDERLELLAEAERARFARGRCARIGVHAGAARAAAQLRDQLQRRVTARRSSMDDGQLPLPGRDDRDSQATLRDRDRWLRRLLLAGFPDRVARRRDEGSARALLVGGRGVALGPQSVVREASIFLALHVNDRGDEGRVTLASAIDACWLSQTERREHRFDPASGRVLARAQRCYLDLVLAERPESPDGERAAALLAEHAGANLADALDLDSVAQLRARVTLLHEHRPQLELPALDDDALRSLLPALCSGKSALAELRREPLGPWLRGLLSTKQQRALERETPIELPVPSGRRIGLRYDPEGGPPVLAVKLQELFGLRETPRVAGGAVSVLLHLLAPNGRPVQVTQDLASFWQRTYAEVRKELRQRYPKHPWPEDPTDAVATHKTKRQLARGR